MCVLQHAALHVNGQHTVWQSMYIYRTKDNGGGGESQIWFCDVTDWIGGVAIISAVDARGQCAVAPRMRSFAVCYKIAERYGLTDEASDYWRAL